MARWLLALAAVLLSRCGEGSPEPPPPPTDFELLVGSATDPMTGNGRFRAVASGADLPLRPGAQGGLHVFIHLQLSEDAIDEATETPVIYREARRVSDQELVSRTEHRGLFVQTGTVAAYETESSLRLFLCPTPVDIDVADQPLDLRVDVMTDYGETPVARGTLRFVPRCAAEDEATCRRLCLW